MHHCCCQEEAGRRIEETKHAMRSFFYLSRLGSVSLTTKRNPDAVIALSRHGHTNPPPQYKPTELVLLTLREAQRIATQTVREEAGSVRFAPAPRGQGHLNEDI